MNFGKVGLSVSKVKEIAVELPPNLRERVLDLIKDVRGNTAQIDLSEVPEQFIQLCLERLILSPNQRKAMYLFITKDQKEMLDTLIDHPREVHNVLSSLATTGEPNAEIQIKDRWYPVCLHSQYFPPNQGIEGGTQISACLSWIGGSYNFSWWVGKGHFSNEVGAQTPRTTRDLFCELGIRPLKTDMVEYARLLRLAEKIGHEEGVLVNSTNSALRIAESWFRSGLMSVPLGSPTSPMRVIVEPELESGQGSSLCRMQRHQATSEVPLIRVFSLDRKEYLFMDVRDVEEYVFDAGAVDRLVLPEKISSVLRKVFDSDISKLFGDLLRGKHGGMVILAHGGPGVGKTLTAEVFAEHTKRPLYVMEMGELGTSLSEVEKNLRLIFARATRWNAVLLLDEADVFLATRDDNLERSAIVGVFLRLLDYYPGLFFLTSNRVKVIDPAFKSRITLRLNYPDLNVESRGKIWGTVLKLARIEVVDGLNGIPEIELNGREIRNLVRLVKVVHGERVSHDELRNLAEYMSD